MNVGDYVRTKKGIIGKIEDFVSSLTDDYVKVENQVLIQKKVVIKSSPNIIDLIQIEDYVNGEKVKAVNNFGVKPLYWFVNTDKNTYFEIDIKNIVTKEQFKSIEYKVRD